MKYLDFEILSKSWRYCMSVKASNFTSHSTVCSSVCSFQQETLAFCGRIIILWLMDSLHKGPVTWKAFTCHGVIIYNWLFINRDCCWQLALVCKISSIVVQSMLQLLKLFGLVCTNNLSMCAPVITYLCIKYWMPITQVIGGAMYHFMTTGTS